MKPKSILVFLNGHHIISNTSIANNCFMLKFLKTKKQQKLEDLKVLRRSPDLLNNVKIGKVNYSL